MHFKQLAGLLGLVFYLTTGWAQSLSIETDTVSIHARRLEDLGAGHRLVTIDSMALAGAVGQNLSDLLATHADIFIKSYGAGGLATTSIRGGGASHLAVRWNGFHLQSPMNGQQDLALIPAFFLDQVSLQYGSGGALFGSGAVGGTLILDQNLGFSGLVKGRVMMGIGSFGDQQLGLEVQASQQKWAFRTRYHQRSAQNDFFILSPYSSVNGQQQTHAAFSQRGLLQEAAYRINEKQELQFWWWHQEKEQEVPPTLSQDSSAATQWDQSNRLAMAWEYESDRLALKVRSAYLTQDLRYRDPLATIDAPNLSQTWIQVAEAFFNPSAGHALHFGVNHTYQQAQAHGYGNNLPRQRRFSLMGSYHLRWLEKHLELILSTRQEWVDGKAIPVIPSLGGRWGLASWFSLKGQIGRSYRLPTFNDRFWEPGGNPDLDPERGWGGEIGLQGRWENLEWETTTFSRQIRDWILWLPGEGGYWTPENVRQVWSRGLENQLGWHQQWGNGGLRGQVCYTFTRATVQESSQPRDGAIGQQLIYTPEHQGRGRLSLNWSGWHLSYSHNFTGRRYTLSDNSQWLTGYWLGQMRLSYSWRCNRLGGSLDFNIHNLWNTPYTVIADRPMPGRNYALSLNIDFFQPLQPSIKH